MIGIRAGEIVYDGPTSEVTQEVLNLVYMGKEVPTAGEKIEIEGMVIEQ